MTGGAQGETHLAPPRRRGGLGKAVAGTFGCVVVVAVAAAVYDSLTSDDVGVDLTDDELAAALLTEAEVRDAATAAGPYDSVLFETAVAGVDGIFAGGLDVSVDRVEECDELARRILPGRRVPAVGAAFRRSDGTVVLHTLDPVEDGDTSVTDLGDSLSICGSQLATVGNSSLQLVAGGAGELELGDAAFVTRVDVHPVVDGRLQQGQNFVEVAMIERDGVVATLTVVGGEQLSDPGRMARSLAGAVDAKLAGAL